jgi:hypothetical protein
MGAAAAAARSSITFSFANAKVSAKQSATLNYSANVPAGSTLAVQREFGTANVWRNVTSLPSTSGTASVPGVAMGEYHYRIVAKHGTQLVTSASHPLYSYGTVHLDHLCNNPSGALELRMANTCDGATVQIGGTVFSYAGEIEPSQTPQYDIAVQATASTCRSITVQWGISDNDSRSGTTATLTVARADADPRSGTVPTGQVGTLQATLDRTAWNIDLSASEGDEDEVAINGVLSCYTATATP